MGSFCEQLSRDNHLTHFKYSLNQVQLSAKAGRRVRKSLSRTNSANIRREVEGMGGWEGDWGVRGGASMLCASVI